VQDHLHSCAQCQHELAELNATVKLLHALPQPALPRSFTLPSTITQDAPQTITTRQRQRIHARKLQTAANCTQSALTEHPTHDAGNRRRSRTTLRAFSSLTAVAGVLLVLSGFFNTLPFTAALPFNAANDKCSGTVGNGQQTGLDHNGNLVTPIVQGASNDQNVTPSTNQPSPATKVEAPQTTGQHAPAVAKPAPANHGQTTLQQSVPWLALLDLHRQAGRIGLGILFLLLGSSGLLYFTRSRPIRAGPPENAAHS
jgi:hypothetical protein